MFTQVSLNKNGWHYKLQDWMFDHVPFTSNFCPYFWLTIFCVLATPFVAFYRYPVKLTGVGFIYCIVAPFYMLEKAVDFVDIRWCQPLFARRTRVYVDTMSDNDAYNLFGFMFGWGYNNDKLIENEDDSVTPIINYDFGELKSKVQSRYYARWTEWRVRAGDKWTERIKNARAKHLKAQEESKETRLSAEKQRKQFFNKLVKYTKLMVFLPIGIVGVYLIYWLSLLGIVIVENWSAIVAFFAAFGLWLWNALPYVGAVILAVIVLILLVGLVVSLVKKCNISFPGASLAKKVWSPFKSVGNFFVMYFKAFKENHCPAIEWDE